MGTALVILLAYLFGSIPVGVLVARTYGIDIQKVGSGNTGATNVLRAAGWGPALIVAFADMFKGGLAVLVALLAGLPGWEIAMTAFAAVLGHNYSVFLGFRGGKGVAASFGTVLLMDPGLALGVFPFFVATILVTRYVSAGSIMGAVAALILSLAMGREGFKVAICLGLLVMVVFKHRDNLARMYEGTERRIDQRDLRKDPAATAVPLAPTAPTEPTRPAEPGSPTDLN